MAKVTLTSFDKVGEFSFLRGYTEVECYRTCISGFQDHTL